jgi:4-hydroxybenzoate polyprenyltransferase
LGYFFCGGNAVKSHNVFFALIRLARPKHWVKNVFVLLPVPFAVAAKIASPVPNAAAFYTGAFLQETWLSFLCGFFGFCLLNSSIYTLNDLFDARADIHHPVKRHRPVASGLVPVWAAALQSILLCACGMLLCLAANKSGTVAIAITYLMVNIAYNMGAKHVALLDVFLLSSGFVLRVLLGCALVSAYPSAWLLLCTSSLALFLGFAKRRADLKVGLDHKHRPSLRGYSLPFLDQAISVCAGTAVLSYALYSIEAKVLLEHREMASMPFVVFGILNYLRMADVEGTGGSPVEIALHSVSTQICVLGWAISVTWSLGLW